jgi:hypothetical protein
MGGAGALEPTGGNAGQGHCQGFMRADISPPSPRPPRSYDLYGEGGGFGGGGGGDGRREVMDGRDV